MAANIENVEERLQEVFHDIFDDTSIKIHPKMTAEDVEDWDSLAHVRLIVSVETEFEIEFNSAEIEEFTDVGKIMQIIATKIG